jgi:hypothetical protein
LAGRTADEARTTFIALTQRALSCLSDAVVYYRAAPVGQAEILIVSEDPLRLPRDTGGGLQLTLDQQYTLVNEEGTRKAWKVSTRGYRYQLSDDAGREIAAWHWHPQGRSRERRPHLHVADGPLAGLHLPSGPIGVESIFRLLLAELNVRSRRTDWEQVLTEVDETFRAWRAEA